MTRQKTTHAKVLDSSSVAARKLAIVNVVVDNAFQQLFRNCVSQSFSMRFVFANNWIRSNAFWFASSQALCFAWLLSCVHHNAYVLSTRTYHAEVN